MKLELYQVDAFASNVFEGNPAAICPLAEWLPDEQMQAIAMENNLSETAFFIPAKGEADYEIRWFTPVSEVDLCGHATLAAAHVLFSIRGHGKNAVSFHSRSGMLRVTRLDDWLEMDFPSQAPHPSDISDLIVSAFGERPVECLRGQDHVVVFRSEQQVIDAHPDMEIVKKLDLRGVAITAQGSDCDFVTRFFAPKYGINEDPVTGSAFTQLIPYWANRTGNDRFLARQLSARGGEIRCASEGDRVRIAGRAVTYLEGQITV